MSLVLALGTAQPGRADVGPDASWVFPQLIAIGDRPAIVFLADFKRTGKSASAAGLMPDKPVLALAQRAAPLGPRDWQLTALPDFPSVYGDCSLERHLTMALAAGQPVILAAGELQDEAHLLGESAAAVSWQTADGQLTTIQVPGAPAFVAPIYATSWREGIAFATVTEGGVQVYRFNPQTDAAPVSIGQFPPDQLLLGLTTSGDRLAVLLGDDSTFSAGSAAAALPRLRLFSKTEAEQDWQSSQIATLPAGTQLEFGCCCFASDAKLYACYADPALGGALQVCSLAAAGTTTNAVWSRTALRDSFGAMEPVGCLVGGAPVVAYHVGGRLEVACADGTDPASARWQTTQLATQARYATLATVAGRPALAALTAQGVVLWQARRTLPTNPAHWTRSPVYAFHDSAARQSRLIYWLGPAIAVLPALLALGASLGMLRRKPGNDKPCAEA